MLKRSKVLVILLALCVFTTLFASMSAFGASKEIIFWAMPNADDAIHKPWMEKKIAEFQAKTGIKVKFEVVGWGDAWTRISTAIATGEGVDAFQVGTTWNPQFAATGGLEQINLAKLGGKGAFMKANLDSCKYKAKYYGVPWFAETRCLFYNKDMFTKAGIQPPKTHTELITAGEKIVKVFGEGTAISIAGTNAWDIQHNWAIILWANGGSLLSKNNKKAAFNSAIGVKSMKWYMDLVVKGLANKACAEYNQPQADAAFVNGNVAMCYMGPWNVSGIELNNPKLNYGIVEPPVGDKGKASFSGGSNLVILKASRNKEAALKWIQFITQDATLVDYCKNLTHMLPAKVKAFNDPYYSTGVWKTFKTTLGYATAYPSLGVWGDVENAFVQEIKNVLADFVNGKYTEKTIKTYLDRAAERVNTALAKEK